MVFLDFLCQFLLLWGKKLDFGLYKKIVLKQVFLFVFTDATRKAIKEGQLPRLNMPDKSIQSSASAVSVSRSTTVIEKREEFNTAFEFNSSLEIPTRKDVYANFDKMIERSRMLKAVGWRIIEESNYLKLEKVDGIHVTPQLEIYVDTTLKFTVRVFGWVLPQDHLIYTENERSVKNVTLSSLMNDIEAFKLCGGLQNTAIMKHAFRAHCIPKKFDLFDETIRNAETTFYRSESCILMCRGSDVCQNCSKLEKAENRIFEKRKSELLIPAKLNAPISATAPERVVLTLREHRETIKAKEELIAKLQSSIDNNSVKVTDDLDQDLKAIFNKCDKRKINDFMKLFWEEQIKSLSKSASQVRYHPMIIKFCLALYAKSPAAYDLLRLNEKEGSGCLILPSKRTLRDYRNYIKPKTGFNTDIINDLSEKTTSFSNLERFVCLSFDEMKIQEDLVWNKHTGELIGFVDLGDVNLNYSVLPEDVSKLATHVLVIMIRSIMNPLSYTFATFATSGISSFEFFPIFWKAVGILEITCGLKVVAATGDGASANHSFFKMHKGFTSDLLDIFEGTTTSDVGVTYKTLNIFSSEVRYIFFFLMPRI